MSNEGEIKLQHGMRQDVIDQRSRHDALIVEEVRSGSRTIPIRARVASDARLRESMTPEQETAYDSIYVAYGIITAGLGMRTGSYGHVCGGGSGVEHGATLLARYLAWQATCKARYYSPIMAIEIIVEGLTLRQVDEKHKMRNGTARENLVNCLGQW